MPSNSQLLSLAMVVRFLITNQLSVLLNRQYILHKERAVTGNQFLISKLPNYDFHLLLCTFISNSLSSCSIANVVDGH